MYQIENKLLIFSTNKIYNRSRINNEYTIIRFELRFYFIKICNLKISRIEKLN